MNILALETSCDETSTAVLKINNRQLNLLALNTSSQIKLHAPYGGVVPELAARRHVEIIIPLIEQTLSQAKIKPSKIDALAVTGGPGLITALQVGVETGKILAAIWHKPLIPVNHITGHLVSSFLSPRQWFVAQQKNTWPAVALVVSGGHTEIHLMKSINRWRLLGRTLDDAAGEAFDKVAKMLGLPYPGGPAVAKLAKSGNSQTFNLPRPMIKNQDYNFSFAGLKTAVLYSLKKYSPSTISHQLKANMCASFQQAAIDVLLYKIFKAAQEFKTKTIIVSGGVSANQELRRQLTLKVNTLHPTPYTLLPDLEFTGDNAAMIALAAYVISNNGKNLPKYKMTWKNLTADANWELWN